MAMLEALTQGARTRGLAGAQVATIPHANWIGQQAVAVTYKLEATGQVANYLVFRGDEATREVVEQGAHWAFDAPEARFRLVMEAAHIRMAYLFDLLLALSTSQLEALPHQISEVYETMLRRQPLRFLLAADTDALETLTGETRSCSSAALASLLGAEVKVRLEIEAHIPSSVPTRCSAT